MNERIRELMAQAGFDPDAIQRMGIMPQAEKFAELIVRECARVDSEANNVDHVDGETYNQTILQHFGVEE